MPSHIGSLRHSGNICGMRQSFLQTSTGFLPLLSAMLASEVYALFGKDGLDDTMPAPDTPERNNHVGYHLRTGVHNILAYDWQQYIAFANKHFR